MKFIITALTVMFALVTCAEARCNPKCGSKALKRILDPFTYSLRCGP